MLGKRRNSETDGCGAPIKPKSGPNPRTQPNFETHRSVLRTKALLASLGLDLGSANSTVMELEVRTGPYLPVDAWAGKYNFGIENKVSRACALE